MTEACKNCIFSRVRPKGSAPGPDFLDCRVSERQVYWRQDMLQYYSEYPVTPEKDWCGKYQTKRKLTAK